ncbi:hypothetical protein Tco_0735874 [Tanacetum coccineum]
MCSHTLTDITIGARITIWSQDSISLPPEAEVERLLAMTTPSPSPPISLSPPSAGERLVRSMAPPTHSSPPHVPSPLLPSSGCPTQIQTLRPLLMQYEVRESFTARPTRGRGIDYGFVSTVDAEERRQGTTDVRYGIKDTWVDSAKAVPEIAPMTVGEAELAALQETDRRRQAQMVETLRVIRDMRQEMTNMRAELLALREQQRRARQPGPDARSPDHQDASGDADSHI